MAPHHQMAKNRAEITAQLTLLAESIEQLVECFFQARRARIFLFQPLPPRQRIRVGLTYFAKSPQKDALKLGRSAVDLAKEIFDEAASQVPPEPLRTCL